jgi:DNA-binding transcriptional ArsR family regulator
MGETMKESQLPPVLRAVADSTRLKILLMLEAKPRTVGEIVDFFELSQPTITRHLQTLASAGLVNRSRKGQNVYYELAAEKVRMMCSNLAACFPCCCVSAKAEANQQIQVLTIVKRRPKESAKKKQSRRKKGGAS